MGGSGKAIEVPQVNSDDDPVAPAWMVAIPFVLTAVVCWLLPIPVVGIALIVSAVFYGMWLEQRVWQPCIRKREARRRSGKPE